MWDALYSSPWQSKIWQEAFPEYKTLTDDIEKAESPEYIPNPSSTVKGNLIFNKDQVLGDICDSAKTFGDISENNIYFINKTNDVFVNAESGNYEVRDIEEIRETITDFSPIPYQKIGRVN